VSPLRDLGVLYSEKFFGSLLVGRDSNPDERMSGMETRPTKRVFIVQGAPKGHDGLGSNGWFSPISPQVPDDGANRPFLKLHTLSKLELDEGSCKIVLRIPDFEVHVPFQVVGKEPKPKFEGDKPDGIEEIFVITRREEGLRFRELTLEDDSAEVGIETNRFPPGGFFSQGIAAGPEAVADVIVHQPRLDGIQVDEAHGPASGGIHQDIAHLGVAVYGPRG